MEQKTDGVPPVVKDEDAGIIAEAKLDGAIDLVKEFFELENKHDFVFAELTKREKDTYWRFYKKVEKFIKSLNNTTEDI